MVCRSYLQFTFIVVFEYHCVSQFPFTVKKSSSLLANSLFPHFSIALGLVSTLLFHYVIVNKSY